MSDPSAMQPRPAPSRWGQWILAAIVALFVVLGILYAVYTPAWQAPDEPAHYNYVRHLAEHGTYPILKPGDYPAAYLEEIKGARFPPEMSIDPIRYEFHQPPLYYVLAVPVYRLFGGALLPLRLFSVAMGALLLLVVYRAVAELAPERPGLALGTAAFVAFLPMHIAMTAAVNNDTLAELLVATILLLALRYLRRAAAPPDEAHDLRLLVLLGIATGLGFLTKTSAYIAVPLVLTAVAARHLWLDAEPPPWWGTLKAIFLFLLPAACLGLPWWLRNVALYGGLDLLGLGRHGYVVAGQLRTAEFIAQHGSGRLIHDFLITSFHSFWGQFGWMGVLLDSRLYGALAVLSGVAAAGFVARLAGTWQRHARFRAWQWAGGGLLALAGLLSLASYVWYNTQFLQHQGRYLFPALLPMGLAVALGWHEALRRERALLMCGLAILSAMALWLAGGLSAWPMMMLGGTAALFGVRRVLPERLTPWIQAMPYLLLPPLALACLFLFVLPQLAR